MCAASHTLDRMLLQQTSYDVTAAVLHDLSHWLVEYTIAALLHTLPCAPAATNTGFTVLLHVVDIVAQICWTMPDAATGQSQMLLLAVGRANLESYSTCAAQAQPGK